MTDLALSTENDLLVVNGQLVLLSTQEELTRQRLMISLNTFTKTWFENQNFGINQELIFQKGTQGLLDQDVKTIITETTGVVKLLEFVSRIDTDRVYRNDFTYLTEEGDIVSVANVSFSGNGLLNTVGIFEGGVWNYLGIWDDEAIWPE